MVKNASVPAKTNLRSDRRIRSNVACGDLLLFGGVVGGGVAGTCGGPASEAKWFRRLSISVRRRRTSSEARGTTAKGNGWWKFRG
jgi:hypothetical protein